MTDPEGTGRENSEADHLLSLQVGQAGSALTSASDKTFTDLQACGIKKKSQEGF